MSALLSRLVAEDADNGHYVMSPLLSSLDADVFQPIAEFLDRREYRPNILDEGTEWVRLEADFTPRERGQEIVRSGVVYDLARMLEIRDLQDLAFRKLKVLGGVAESVPPLAILSVIEQVFESANDDLRQYLIRFTADEYWPLIMAETEKMAEIMQTNANFAKSVFILLGETGVSDGILERKEESDTEQAIDDQNMATKEGNKKNLDGDVIENETKEPLEGPKLENTFEDSDFQMAGQESSKHHSELFLDAY